MQHRVIPRGGVSGTDVLEFVDRPLTHIGNQLSQRNVLYRCGGDWRCYAHRKRSGLQSPAFYKVFTAVDDARQYACTGMTGEHKSSVFKVVDFAVTATGTFRKYYH